MKTITSLPLIFIAFFYLTGTFAQTNFIKKSCANVTCPSLCQRSLSPYAELIKTNSAVLARTALIVTLKRVQYAQAYINKLKRFNGLKPLERVAIGDCLVQMNLSLDQVSESIKEFKNYDHAKGHDFSTHMDNVKLWVGGVMTCVDWCVDGFGDRAVDGKIKTSVLAEMTSLWNVTSNALHLVDHFAQKH